MFSKILRPILFAMLAVVCMVTCATTILDMANISLALPDWVAWLSHPGTGVALAYVTVAPFPTDPKLTSLSIAYQNKRLIADSVLPRKRVGAQNFKYRLYDSGAFLTIPETAVSRKGVVNQVELGFSEPTSCTIDHGLDDVIPVADIENAPEGYDPRAAATLFLTQLHALDREKRVADYVCDANNYGASNKSTLSGTSQFSHASSTPISAIEDAIDACFQRPNKMVMSRAVWKKFCQHADIVAAANHNSGTKGKARPQDVADLFEMDEILIGEGWYNSAKPGQTVTKSRVWGKSLLLFYSDPIADTMFGLTFGLTAQFGDKFAGEDFDKKIGLRGSVIIRQGESVKELITCSDCAYLFSDAVA
jgi:hypothetical protein